MEEGSLESNKEDAPLGLNVSNYSFIEHLLITGDHSGMSPFCRNLNRLVRKTGHLNPQDLGDLVHVEEKYGGLARGRWIHPGQSRQCSWIK